VIVSGYATFYRNNFSEIYYHSLLTKCLRGPDEMTPAGRIRPAGRSLEIPGLYWQKLPFASATYLLCYVMSVMPWLLHGFPLHNLHCHLSHLCMTFLFICIFHISSHIACQPSSVSFKWMLRICLSFCGICSIFIHNSSLIPLHIVHDTLN